jgi:hypothetical protein
MIRRPGTDNDSWLLIPQAEHARLCGEIASAWQAPEFGEIEPRDALLYAVGHHDDGWPEWEQSPRVDSLGRPVNFDEMPTVDAIEIWRRSIARCAEFDPIAGYAVAGHFSTLLRRFSAWKRGPDDVRGVAEAFLADFNRQMDRWLADWPARPAAAQTSAGHAVAVLQMFDALSLWLCCQARTEAAKFLFPGAGRFELVPAGEGNFVVSPWPLRTAELQLSVPAHRVLARAYHSQEDLAGAIGTIVTIQWRLCPSGAVHL